MTKPLQNTTVVDFTKFLPGPYCTWMLAELGATVIRIENPREVLKQRKVFGWDALTEEQLARLRAQDILAAGKRSVMLDPGEDEARQAIFRLIDTADILVEDYRPGIMQSMGYGYDTVRAVNPSLIYCSVTLCGQTGPYSSKPGHDPVALAISGALSRMGDDPQKPSFAGVPVADLLSGSNAVIGILAALLQRQQTQCGQHLDVAMSDASMALIANVLSRHTNLQNIPAKGMHRADSGIWQTADDKFVVTTDMEPRYWQRFCEVIGEPELAGEQMNSSLWPEMKMRIAAIIRQHPQAYWCDKFERADTQFAPVLNIAEAIVNEHNLARNMVSRMPLGGDDSIIRLHAPVKLTGMAENVSFPGRVPGADSADVLSSLGYSDTEISRLIKDL